MSGYCQKNRRVLSLLVLFFVIKGNRSAEIEGPKFVEEPPSQIQFLSDVGLDLNCSATGNPMPSIQWHCGTGTPCSTISGLRLLHDTSLSLLPFSADTFRRDIHERTYRCVAGNSFGTLVKDVAVKGLVLPSKIEPKVPSISALVDYPALLPCQFPSDFAEVISWVRDDLYMIFPNKPSDKYMILPNGSLLIWQVSSPDFYSKFQCRVRTKFGGGEEHLSSNGRIKHPSPEELGRPVISSYFPPRVRVEEGQGGVLPCLALGSPKPKVQWYRRQGNLPGGQFYPLASMFDDARFDPGNAEMMPKIQIRQGVLIIPSVRRLHAGTYSCNVTNLLGSVGHQVELVAHSSLELTLLPPVLTVDLGKQAEFTCTCSDPTADMQWLKDGVQLKSGSFSGRLRVSKHKLQISRASKEDQGVYQCLGKSFGEEFEQKSSELRLGDLKPILLYTFIDQTVLPGTIISVRCKGTGWPIPTVTWSLDGFELPTSERFTMDQFVVEDVVNSYINITGVVTSDAGEYSCAFRNPAGETTHSNRINVYGDLLIRPMTEVIAIFGKPFKLKCPVGGWPVDKVMWTKENIQLPLSVHQKVTPDGTLLLDNVIKADGGSYKCVASRQAQTAEGTVEVSVIVLPAITPFQFGNAVAGDRVSVLCSLTTTDLKNISITWVKNGRPLDSLTNTQKPAFRVTRIDEFTSSLSMQELSPKLDGNYTCKVSSASHPHITAAWTSTLHVNVPPRITKFNFEEMIVEGMKVQALCFSQGDLPLSFKWFRDETPLLISESNGFNIASFGANSEILTIESVGIEMGGVISCQVSNRAGNAIHSALLMIKVPPKFSVEPKDISASVGGSIKVRCEADGRPLPRVKWLQENRPPAHDNYRDADSIPGVRNVNGTLTLIQLSKDHAGPFVCQATNDVGPPINKRIQINVYAPPKIRLRSGKEIAEIGQEVTLRCDVDGDSPIRVSWKLNGVELSRAQKLNESTSEYKIKSVRLADRGDYACFATNSFGHDFFKISLLVQEIPQSPSNLRVLHQSSRSVTLAWSIVAYIDAYVLEFILRHKRGGSENWTIEVVSGDESSRTIKNLLPCTTYAFTISARNQIGSSHPSQVLLVTTDAEEPSAARHLTVEEIQGSGNILRVSWVRPEFPNGLITHYNVLYQQNSEGYGSRGAEKYRNVPSSRSSLNLRVEPSSQYSILVRAVNNAGMGSNSTLIQIQTREGVPKYSPQEVRCEGLSHKSLQITWKPPRSPHNGLLLGFRVNLDLIQYDATKIVGSSSEFESEVTGTSTVIQGLRELGQYSVTVAAFTTEGTGPPSRALLCYTKEALPNIPSELKVIEHLGYVILAWAYNSRPNETLRKFNIYVRTRIEGQVLKKSVPANTRKYELRHLGHDQVYESCVTAENLVGEGNPSRPVAFKMPIVDRTVSVPPTILSFGHRLSVPWKTDVILECQYTPTEVRIEVIWKRSGVILEGFKEDILELRSVKFIDSGNYSCHVTNGVQTDQITYTLNVQVPPEPPILRATKIATNSSTILSWSFSPSSNMPRPLGYNLNHRPLDGEWEEINLDKRRSTYELRLSSSECFLKSYELFLTAYNSIGTSLPSETLRVEVEGHFNFPPYMTYTTHNSTSITLNFSSLPLFECENALLTLEFKTTDENQWILGHVTNWTDAVTISDLQIHKEYDFRLRVQSGQNSKVQQFQISLSHSTSLDRQTLSGVYRDAVVVIPLTFALVAIVSSIVGSFVFWWRRRKEKKVRQNLSLGRNSFSMHDKTGISEREYAIIREKHMKGANCATETDDDIHPYATFHMNPNRVAQNLPSNAHDLYYDPTNKVSEPDESDYATYRYTRTNSQDDNSPRERDYIGEFNPRSSSFYCSEANSRIVADKRSSLPRSRHRRNHPTSCEVPSLETDKCTDRFRASSSSSSSGANSGAHNTRSIKRRRRDEDPYICHHDHTFINV